MEEISGMKRKTGIILFLLLILTYIPHLKAEENRLNVDNFRKQLKKVNSAGNVNTKKAGIKTFSNRYIVSPGDSLSVSVLGEPEISQDDVLVKCDGYINVHPVGEVRVAGFNVDEVKGILAARLKKYFVEPIVSVHVANTHVPKIYIYGAIQKPGLYQHYKEGNIAKALNSMPLTLASVIAEAGGIKYNADIENIQVINDKTGTKRTYNLLNLIKNGDAAQDIYLSSGDRVFVPFSKTNAMLSDEDFLLVSGSSIAPEEFPVRVKGAVKSPGVHFLTSRSPGVNTAIAASEGFTFNAKKDAVKIHRVTPAGNISTLIVDPAKNDVVLRPNDTIDVYDKRTSVLGKIHRFFMTLVSAAGGSSSWLLVD